MIDLEMLKEEQLKLAKKVVLKDFFDMSEIRRISEHAQKPSVFDTLELIGGVDVAFNHNDVVSAIVICDYKTMEVKEKVFAVAKAKIPYLQGFLAYREGPVISEAYAKLENKPDVLIFDGNGILHPRRCGLASHMGILLNQSSIGIAKHLLVGEVKNNKVYVDNEVRAELVVTREHSKPIYVSPGHKISLKTSVEIVKNCLRFPHKLPEPLHLAHRYANEIREKIAKGELKVEDKE